MAYKSYNFPGLTNLVYLPEWIPVEIKIIPSSVPGWTSGQKIPVSNFTSTTWHDTGNPTSSATGEWNWANGGGRAQIKSPGSYNGIFDATKIIICQRFDELVGHAANPTGNVTSYAFEQAGWGPGFDFHKSLEVGTYLHAGVLHAMGGGRNGTNAMYQHNYWSGKNCPGEIRRRGLWSPVEKMVDSRVADIESFLNKPTLPQKRTFTLRFDTYLRTVPGFWDTDKNQNNVVRLLKAGTTGEVLEGPKLTNGVEFYLLKMGNETGWLQDQVLHTLEIS